MPQDSVRVLAVDICVAMGKRLPQAAALKDVFPEYTKLAKDPSWRVRWGVSALAVAYWTPEPKFYHCRPLHNLLPCMMLLHPR